MKYFLFFLINIFFLLTFKTVADCSHCSFDNKNLANLVFKNQDLSNASFKKAYLVNADFSGANLTGAIFDGAYANGAVFVGAQLDNSSFRKTELELANFKNASLHAGEGDLQTSAIFILKALDKERRASGVGPQVLHLIKTN